MSLLTARASVTRVERTGRAIADRLTLGRRLARGASVVALGLGAACSSKSDPSPAPAPSPTATGDGGSSSPAPDPGPAAWKAVVGAGGIVAQTFDDVTWSTRNVGATDLFAVACLGNLRGWTAGARGAVAYTADGGKTWRAQMSGLTDDLHAVRFGQGATNGTSVGIVAGDHGAAALTRDGGVTWAKVSAPDALSTSWHGAAVAADAGVIVLAGDGAMLLRSLDAGATWSRVVISGAGDLRGVASDSGARVVVAVDGAGAIWSSTDRAGSFRRDVLAAAPLEAVTLSDDGSRGLAVGARGTALERDASGAWRTVVTGVDSDLHAALITDGASRAYVAGDRGTLATQAGHAAYTAIDLGTTATLYGLEDL